MTVLNKKPVITNCQFYVLILHLLCRIFLVNAPLVENSQGILNGTIQESRSKRKYSAFLGIPYGKPPVGRLRFANPVEAENWKGIRAANVFGSICIQIDPRRRITGDEDCLFLNVYTPLLEFSSSSTKNTLLPVMVWIHGGSFTVGSSNVWGAKNLLDKGVILVTLNYRLGIFGFWTTGDSAAPGNFGMKDQVVALKWVQKNIQFFGGDSNQVTLFGQSAGGASVSLHAISKASDGLFQKYIMQSGANLSPWAFQNKTNIERYTRHLSVLNMCVLKRSRDLLNCMQKISPKRLLRMSATISSHFRAAELPWSPTDEPDAEGAFLTDNPKNMIRSNQMKDLPFMSGIVTDEGLTATAVSYGSHISRAVARAIRDRNIAYAGAHYVGRSNVRPFRRAVIGSYFADPLQSVSRTRFLSSLTMFVSDAFFFYPQLRMLEIVTPQINSPNYFYIFAYKGSATQKNGLGVAHSEELIYLFNVLPDFTPIPDSTFTAADLSISKIMVEMWTSFAINGKPTSNELNDPDIWLPYTTQNPVYLQIGDINNNTDPTVTLNDASTFNTDRMNFWRKIAPI